MRRHAAFTLFEVAISLLIVSATVLAVVLILPVGIRAQSEARHELFAAAAAMTLLDNAHHPVPVIGTPDRLNQTALETGVPLASGLRRALVYASSHAPDIEQHLSQPDMGALPLPTAIAGRLDSEGDEIARLLDAGGQLFYLHPNNTRALHSVFTSKNSSLRVNPPPEFHELVFAVVGAPQQNLLPAHPIAERPHYETYPFPPSWIHHKENGLNQHMNGGRAFRAPDGMAAQVTLGGAWSAATPHGNGTWIGLHHTRSNQYSYTFAGDPNLAEPGDELWDLTASDRLQLVHGRNWLDYARRDPAGPWAAGLPAWVALAGDFTGGWLPIQNLLNLATPVWNSQKARIEINQLAGEACPLPTYEMRADYRDRAIDLWQAVAPGHPGLATLAARYAPQRDDLRLDCDRYRYPPAELARFAALEPQQLAAVDFPPHPSQVMALSFLAHSALMVAGLRPPFDDRRDVLWFDGMSRGSDSDGDGIQDTFTDATGGAWVKDAKRFRVLGATRIEITSDAYTDVEFYAGDHLWTPEVPGLVFEVAADLSVPKGGSTGTLDLSDAYPVLGADQGFRYGPAQVPALNAGIEGLATRVATARDLAFAVAVHEMCLQWAICYARERPYDWGAPRPANRASSLDRPLALWDLFPGGSALRPTDAGFYTDSERCYRFLQGFNPAADRYPGGLQFPRDPAGAISDYAVTHVPLDTRLGDELDATTAHALLTATNTALDRERFWPARPFDHRDRGRELVFWAVAWQDYEDVERAPGAAMDLAKLGWTVADHGGTRRITAPPGSNSNYASAQSDHWFTGHPEQRLAWLNPERDDWGFPDPFSDDRNTTDLDRMGIHWGADRNNNALFDAGSVPPSTRMQARQVARFTVYDPILRLHAGN